MARSRPWRRKEQEAAAVLRAASCSRPEALRAEGGSISTRCKRRGKPLGGCWPHFKAICSTTLVTSAFATILMPIRLSINEGAASRMARR